MADNPSGFIDFNTFYAAQGASEEAAMQRRLDELTKLDEESARLLRLGEGEAERANLDAVRGGGTASMGLSGTASYGQYLKAQQQAKALRAQLEAAAKGIGNRGLGARAAANLGITDASLDARDAEAQRLRDYYLQRGESGIASFNAYADRQRAEAARVEAERKAREEKDKANAKANAAAFLKKWAESQSAPNKAQYGQGLARHMSSDPTGNGLVGSTYWPSGSATPGTFNEKTGRLVRAQAYGNYNDGPKSTYHRIWNDPAYRTRDEKKWGGT